MRLNRRYPLVSVVVIFLNEERFLTEAVQSVIDQTYDDWELILVDDGSSDGSSEIARGFARAHPDRIRYLQHPGHARRGLSPSRNLGLRAAKGELIALLDADDVWLPNKLVEQVQILADHPTVGMVYGATEYWFGWTGSAEDAARDFVRPLGVAAESVLRPPQLLELMTPRIVPSPGPSGIVVRRDVAAQVGFFEDEFTGLYDDHVFIAKVSLATDVYASSRRWYRYRQHPASFYAQAKRKGPRIAARLKYLRWLDMHLERQGYEGAPVRVIATEELRKLSLPLSQRLAGKAARWAPRAHEMLGKLRDRLFPPGIRSGGATLIAGRRYFPPVGRVELGDLRRLTPVSRKDGEDRGGDSVSNHYVETFLEMHRPELRGRVLEVGHRFRARPAAPAADPTGASQPPPARMSVERLMSLPPDGDDPYDCIVVTDLHRAANPAAALDIIFRLLRPGGTVLAAAPGITQVRRDQFAPADDLWRFTARSMRALFSEFCEPEVATHGNVLAATAQLHGLAAGELSAVELAYADPDYPVVITVRAVGRAERRLPSSPAAAPGAMPALAGSVYIAAPRSAP